MRFGDFSVDLDAGEVHRNGVKIRLQELPFRVLKELASRPGQVVTRDELRARLWDASTFVDAEAGLNTAIAKLRDALGDSADAPRFIETIPKRGYRFIAAVQPPLQVTPRKFWGLAFAAVALVTVIATIAAVATVARMTSQKTTIAVVLFHNETGEPAMDALAQLLTDATVVALAANPHYAIIGNAAILRTPRIFADLKTIGETLHAEYIVIAQLQNPPDGLTVRLHFIRATDQKHLWAKSLRGGDAVVESNIVTVVTSGIKDSLGK